MTSPVYKVKLKTIVRHLSTGEGLQWIWEVTNTKSRGNFSVVYIPEQDEVYYADGEPVPCEALKTILKQLSGD